MDSAAITVIVITAAMVFFAASAFADTRKARKAIRNRIRQSWGKAPEAEYKQEDLASIARYFYGRRNAACAQFVIDDITWSDLELDEVFIRLNDAATTPGEETLYRLLREPEFDLAELKARQDALDYFQRNQAERVEIQSILARLGKRRHIHVTECFFQSGPPQACKSGLYRILSAVALLAPMVLLFHGGLGVFVIALSFLTNSIVHYKTRFQIAAELDALGYIVRLVQCAGRIIEADPAGLGEYLSRLTVQYKSLRIIGKRGAYLSFAQTGSLADLACEYFKIILLRELIDYEHLRKLTHERREELAGLYDIVGLIDSLISIASYRQSLRFFCVPKLEENNPEAGKQLQFEEICHPLVKNPVPNSLRLDGCMLVTGSNASGKSTLLKAVAINAIFAQSICTCLAREYSSPMYAVFTSMALRDSTRDGESYFIAEIKSIKRILDYLNDDVPALCLIDEVLRGTNTIERIAASSQVLLHLAKRNCLCIAATHDIELTYILQQSYRNVHFQETITSDGVVFDYKALTGRATSRNAIKLLQMLGYEAAIVEEAEKLAGVFAGLRPYSLPGAGDGFEKIDEAPFAAQSAPLPAEC